MATARAIASGNWSATATWNGGVLPGNGDTVYANGFTVTIDQNVTIGGANNPTVNAGSFVSGQWYQITSTGTTTFTSIGAASNVVGTIFLATGAGSGTGTAKARATITTVASTPAGAGVGGSFVMAAAYNINTNIRGNNTCLSVTASSGNIVISDSIIYGPVGNGSGLSITGAASVQLINCDIGGKTDGGFANGILFSSNGNLVIQNSFISADEASTGNAQSHGILANSTGSLQCSNCTITGGGNLSRGIFNTSTGGVTLNTCTVATISSGLPGVENSSTGAIIANNCTLSANAINNTSNGTVQATNCTFTAVNGVAVISSTNASATNRFSGTFVSSPNGTQPINATRWILNSSPTVSYIQHALDGINSNSFVRFYTADNNLGQANPTDVRSGVSYASGNLTGLLTVPARGSVALSVNYGPSMPFTTTRSGTTATATLAYSYPLVVGDQFTVTGASNSEWNGSYTIASVVGGTSVTFAVPNTHSSTAGVGATMQTTGTAVLDPAAVASAVWGAATRTITGGLVDTATTLTNSPDVPTEAEIASQVRTELSLELGRIDASISSRLAPSGTLATVTTLTNSPSVPSAAAIADEVRVELATELARIDAPISGAGNAPSAATVASAVRSELSTELARVDQAISSRLAGSAYTAPANSDIAAIKAKTDAVNVERINNTATTAIVGNLLAQANS